MALYNAVNDIFAFQSAESAAMGAEPAAQLGERLTTLEDAMAKIASGFKVMMERETARPQPAQAEAPPLMTATAPRPRRGLAIPRCSRRETCISTWIRAWPGPHRMLELGPGC